MEAFGVDERIDEELAELMQGLSREFLGEECSVSSQISESEFEIARESNDDDEEEESDNEDDEEIDSQSIARNYVENCAADSNEECCDVGSRAEIEGIFRDGCSCLEKGSKVRSCIRLYRLQLAEFSREEKDTLLLSKLEGMEVRSENQRTGKRSRQKFRYEFQGLTICENAWRFIHDIGKSKYSLHVRNRSKHDFSFSVALVNSQ
jgi:hypothetical protein